MGIQASAGVINNGALELMIEPEKTLPDQEDETTLTDDRLAANSKLL